MQYNFEWNPTKEKQNIRKHQLNFGQAATVFRDPNHLSLYDEDHSDDEERWITIGLDSTGILRVIIHTFEVINSLSYKIRIISARKATPKEVKQYRERN